MDDLSNWYVRRSRRRFWKGEEDEDKAAAYSTLYECLTTLAKLLAPFMPFIAEEMYQNLVRSVDAAAPESVHHCDYPQADEPLIDEQLVEDTRLVMRLVSLGHGARNRAGIKLRQPLAQAMFRVRSESEADSLRRLSDQVLDELNVKELVVLEDAGQVVEYQVSPVSRFLGQKYGALYPKIRAALAELDSAELARRVRAGEDVAVELEEQNVNLLPEELAVRTEAKAGYAVAEGLPALFRRRPETAPSGLTIGTIAKVTRWSRAMSLCPFDRERCLIMASIASVPATSSPCWRAMMKTRAVCPNWLPGYMTETRGTVRPSTLLPKPTTVTRFDAWSSSVSAAIIWSYVWGLSGARARIS